MTGFSIWLKINRIQQQRSLACWEMKSASLLYSKIDAFINEISKFWVHIMFLENTQCVWVQRISCGPQFRYFVLFGCIILMIIASFKKNYWKHFSTKYFHFIENIFIFSHGFPSNNSSQILHNSPPTQFQPFLFLNLRKAIRQTNTQEELK